jgi:hypothetical protein
MGLRWGKSLQSTRMSCLGPAVTDARRNGTFVKRTWLPNSARPVDAVTAELKITFPRDDRCFGAWRFLTVQYLWPYLLLPMLRDATLNVSLSCFSAHRSLDE